MTDEHYEEEVQDVQDDQLHAARNLLPALLQLFEEWLPIAAVADPPYAASVCEQLRRTVKRVEAYLLDRAVADLRGQMPLPFESPPSSSEMSEKSGGMMPPAQD